MCIVRLRREILSFDAAIYIHNLNIGLVYVSLDYYSTLSIDFNGIKLKPIGWENILFYHAQKLNNNSDTKNLLE